MNSDHLEVPILTAESHAEKRAPVSLGEAMPLEMARVREVLGHYREIGPAGAFGAAFIEQDLREADAAVMSGDIVRMLRAYEKLKGITA